MTITPSHFEAFLKCPTKCWLGFTGEPPTGNPYANGFKPKPNPIAPLPPNGWWQMCPQTSAPRFVAADVMRLKLPWKT